MSVKGRWKSTSPEGEIDPKRAWMKRGLAFLADLLILYLVSLTVYMAVTMPIAGASTPYQQKVKAYEEAVQKKLNFLSEQRISPRKEDGTTYTDEEISKNAFSYYLDGSKEDILRTYYVDKAPFLTPYQGSSPGYETNASPRSMTREEYLSFLSEEFNRAAGEKVFIGGAFLDEGEAYTPYEKLSQYLGVGLKPGQGKTVNEANQALFLRLSSSYLSLRREAALEAISSAQEMPNEIALLQSYRYVNQTRSLAAVLSWAVAYLLTFPLPSLFFGWGRTVGKRILGFYVISSSEKKAKGWQMALRFLLTFFETFWGVSFLMFYIFGWNLFAVPFFSSTTLTVPVAISLVWMLSSASLAFVFHSTMSSLHDLASKTRVIQLDEGTSIDSFLSQEEGGGEGEGKQEAEQR